MSTDPLAAAYLDDASVASYLAPGFPCSCNYMYSIGKQEEPFCFTPLFFFQATNVTHEVMHSQPRQIVTYHLPTIHTSNVL